MGCVQGFYKRCSPNKMPPFSTFYGNNQIIKMHEQPNCFSRNCNCYTQQMTCTTFDSTMAGINVCLKQ